MQMQKLVEIRGFLKNKLNSKILDFLRKTVKIQVFLEFKVFCNTDCSNLNVNEYK